MGKNRANIIHIEKEPMYYVDKTESEVPLGNLDDRLMSNLLYHINMWLEGHSSSPDYGMGEEELEYIVNHMKYTENSEDIVPDGHLYRIENGHHFAEKGLKVGEHLRSSGAFRSFSKDIGATNLMLEGGWRGQKDIVIYRTNGNTPFLTHEIILTLFLIRKNVLFQKKL